MLRIASGMAILPISWREEALTIMAMRDSSSPRSGQFAATSSSSTLVNSWIRLMCCPVSALRYSIMEERASITAALDSLSLRACSRMQSS